MAAIDKTYCNDYPVYKEFIEWAKEAKFKTPSGEYLYVWNYVYSECSEDDMKRVGYVPVMNTPQYLDYFLIKYCPFDFVQNRMKEVYGNEYYESVKNGTSEYDKYKEPEIGTKFVVFRDRYMRHKDYLWRFKGRNNARKFTNPFVIDVEYDGNPLWYSENLKRFVYPNELAEGTSSFCFGGKTVKALLRKLRRLRLPKGTFVRAYGRYVREEILVFVH